MRATTPYAALLAAGLLGCWACAPGDHAGLPGDEGPPANAPADLAPAPIPSERNGKVTPLQRRVEAAIRNVRSRSLMRGNAFWTVFHGILGLGPGVQLIDPATGKKVNALDYVREGGELRGLAFQPTAHGVDVLTLRDTQGQGHQDQFIAEMAQWGIAANKPFRVQGRDYTFLDFVRHSQMRARTNGKQELSWTVIVVAQYLGTGAAWTNEYGERLRLEDLIRYEVDASVEKAPCGGTHMLFGLSWAYHLHVERGGETTGVWKDVADKTSRYARLARESQNADGTFSTAFFAGRGHSADRQLQINSTGHIFEWLALALPDEELRSEWMQGAANALALLIVNMQDAPIDSGSMYHAVHGLYLYHARMYGRSFAPPELMIPPHPARGKAGR